MLEFGLNWISSVSLVVIGMFIGWLLGLRDRRMIMGEQPLASPAPAPRKQTTCRWVSSRGRSWRIGCSNDTMSTSSEWYFNYVKGVFKYCMCCGKKLEMVIEDDAEDD